MGAGQEPQIGPAFYAPLASATGVRTQLQASQILGALRAAEPGAAFHPSWPLAFWAQVSGLEQREGLEPRLRALLQGHGYGGAPTRAAPEEALASDLEGLASSAEPLRGGGAGVSGLAQDVTVLVASPDRWHASLPGDFRRAAPEIYRSIRAHLGARLACGEFRGEPEVV